MTQIETPPLRSQTVADRLRDEIMRGVFAPDERLQEVELAERMGVSRTPIREALSVLSQEGLLVYAPNRGYRMRRFSRDYIMQAFRVRMTLEGLGARLAAERGVDAESRQPFERELQLGDTLLLLAGTPEFDDSAWRDMNRTFHMAVHEHAHNTVLMQAARLAGSVPVVFGGAFVWYSPEDFRRTHAQHHRIFDAIEKRQPERADYLMQEHIYEGSEIIARHYPE